MKVKKIFLSLCLCLFYGLFFLNIKLYAKTRIPARYRAYHKAVISALKNKKTSVELYGKEKEILYYWNQLLPKEENFPIPVMIFNPFIHPEVMRTRFVILFLAIFTDIFWRVKGIRRL